jgi:hypothetical protein
MECLLSLEQRTLGFEEPVEKPAKHRGSNITGDQGFMPSLKSREGVVMSLPLIISTAVQPSSPQGKRTVTEHVSS